MIHFQWCEIIFVLTEMDLMHTNTKRCKISLFMIDARPFHRIIVNLFLEHIRSGVQDLYDLHIVRLTPDKEAIKEIAHSIMLKQQPDIFITVGEMCSVALKEVVDEIGNDYPVLFLGTRDPVLHRFVESLEKPNTSFIGVVRKPASLTMVAEYFQHFYPHVQSVLVPYSEGDYLLAHARAIKRHLTSIGMNVIIVPIGIDAQEIVSVVKSYLTYVQGVILLEACYALVAQEEIAFECSKHDIILCGSGPYAIDNGAACALGGGLELIVESAYELLRKFWELQEPIGTIPVTVLLNNEEFLLNVDRLRRIDFSSDEILRICSTTQVKVVRRWTRPFKIE